MNLRLILKIYNLKFHRKSVKYLKKLRDCGLIEKTKKLLRIIKSNPYQIPPTYEKLIGYDNVYSRRINLKHRLVYKVSEEDKTIYILSLWSHYEINLE